MAILAYASLPIGPWCNTAQSKTKTITKETKRETERERLID